MKVEFRVQADVIDLVLCPTCGHFGIESHIVECVLPAPLTIQECSPVLEVCLNEVICKTRL